MADPLPINAAGDDSAADHTLYTRSDITAARFLMESPGAPGQTLPARASNPAWNRSSAAVGRRVGSAVANIRRFPQTLDEVTSRFSLVIAERGLGLQSSAGEVAGDWQDALEGSVSGMAGAAREYRSLLLLRASRRWSAIRHESQRAFYSARRNTRHRLEKVDRLAYEEPIRFVVSCAAVAFATGIALRVWRSNHE